MAAPIQLFCVLLFLCLVCKGNSQCSLNDLVIKQTPTGSRVGGKTEWRVTISNNCVCSQLSVLLSCNGFQTVEDVDPAILAIARNVCLVNSGAPIYRSHPITFTYAWDNAYPFVADSSQTFCP